MQASVELRPVVSAPPRGRLLLLAALFVAAATIVWSLQGSQGPRGGFRWPTDEDFYAVSGWSVSSPKIEVANGNTFVTRRYQRAGERGAVTFILTTSRNVKTVYRAGPDVPFLGSGYESVPVPVDAANDLHGWGVSLLRRGNQGWLQLYGYGERRGLMGNGTLAWGLGIFDTLLGQPNDYYLVRVLAPTTGDDSDALARASEVANVMFPRMVDWYAH